MTNAADKSEIDCRDFTIADLLKSGLTLKEMTPAQMGQMLESRRITQQEYYYLLEAAFEYLNS